VLQFEILKGRSFIHFVYKINNNGPSIEPWGTPYFTGHNILLVKNYLASKLTQI
jgi:hypothetical protein